MRMTLFIFGALCVFISCNRSNKEITERLANADSVAINYFKGDGTMDTVITVKILRDKTVADQLATHIGENTSGKNFDKCGYDGSLHFFKMSKVIQDVDFRMNEKDCMYFSFMQEGQRQATVLSPEAKELINSLRK